MSRISSHITYLSKNWSVKFIVTTLLLNHISSHITYLFSIIFLLFFDSFYLFINVVVYGYIFSNFPPSLLPFHLPTTININITFPLSLHLPFILTILIPHNLTINLLISFTLYIFYHTKRLLLSLFLVFFFSFGIFFI